MDAVIVSVIMFVGIVFLVILDSISHVERSELVERCKLCKKELDNGK